MRSDEYKLKSAESWLEFGAAHSLEVPVDRLQVVLKLGYELLLSALQRLSVLHAIFQGLEHAAHARAQRLDAADGVREGVQIHPDVHHVRHLLRRGLCRRLAVTSRGPAPNRVRLLNPSGPVATGPITVQLIKKY